MEVKIVFFGIFAHVTSITESFQKMFKMKRIHNVSNLWIYKNSQASAQNNKNNKSCVHRLEMMMLPTCWTIQCLRPILWFWFISKTKNAEVSTIVLNFFVSFKSWPVTSIWNFEVEVWCCSIVSPRWNNCNAITVLVSRRNLVVRQIIWVALAW